MDSAFFGGQRISNNPTDGSVKAWKWSDGKNWDYSVLIPGEPNQAIENVNHLWTETNKIWNDVMSSMVCSCVYKRVSCNTIAIHVFNST